MILAFLKNFTIYLALCLYLCGFIWLMNRAIIEPVNINSFKPVYSLMAIIEWIVYICAGGAVVLTAVFYDKESK